MAVSTLGSGTPVVASPVSGAATRLDNLLGDLHTGLDFLDKVTNVARVPSLETNRVSPGTPTPNAGSQLTNQLHDLANVLEHAVGRLNRIASELEL